MELRLSAKLLKSSLVGFMLEWMLVMGRKPDSVPRDGRLPLIETVSLAPL